MSCILVSQFASLQGRKRTRAAAETVAAASAFSQMLLAARPAGGKKSRARRTIDYLADRLLAVKSVVQDVGRVG